MVLRKKVWKGGKYHGEFGITISFFSTPSVFSAGCLVLASSPAALSPKYGTPGIVLSRPKFYVVYEYLGYIAGRAI